MNEKEVKDYLFKKFLEWMIGQTVGISSKDGSSIYYDSDVERFAEGNFRKRISD